ncbi:hypothetical protein AMTR_s00055p00191850 [Amborella trichopoda]|uniref:Uncharacterized protein n=2 Tax=Amborella trichopoda TaxID=13333 RepID=U5D792_AMBTC|nr:hypothetical protein AMTR_s00055p00191850 [Amborella trichopoda]
MANVELLLYQMFERENWLLSQLEQQQKLFAQAMASSLYLKGIEPPSWLGNGELSSTADKDPKELKKEHLIPGLLFAPPRPNVFFPSMNHYAYQSRPFSMVARKESENLQELSRNGPENSRNSPLGVLKDPKFYSCIIPETSLGRITRSRSRQRALGIRNSVQAKSKNRTSVVSTGIAGHTGRMTRHRSDLQKKECQNKIASLAATENQLVIQSPELEQGVSRSPDVMKQIGCGAPLSRPELKNEPELQAQGEEVSRRNLSNPSESIVCRQDYLVEPKQLVFDDLGECSLNQVGSQSEGRKQEIKREASITSSVNNTSSTGKEINSSSKAKDEAKSKVPKPVDCRNSCESGHELKKNSNVQVNGVEALWMNISNPNEPTCHSPDSSIESKQLPCADLQDCSLNKNGSFSEGSEPDILHLGTPNRKVSEEMQTIGLQKAEILGVPQKEQFEALSKTVEVQGALSVDLPASLVDQKVFESKKKASCNFQTFVTAPSDLPFEASVTSENIPNGRKRSCSAASAISQRSKREVPKPGDFVTLHSGSEMKEEDVVQDKGDAVSRNLFTLNEATGHRPDSLVQQEQLVYEGLEASGLNRASSFSEGWEKGCSNAGSLKRKFSEVDQMIGLERTETMGSSEKVHTELLPESVGVKGVLSLNVAAKSEEGKVSETLKRTSCSAQILVDNEASWPQYKRRKREKDQTKGLITSPRLTRCSRKVYSQ